MVEREEDDEKRKRRNVVVEEREGEKKQGLPFWALPFLLLVLALALEYCLTSEGLQLWD